jgi:hypothetical protein
MSFKFVDCVHSPYNDARLQWSYTKCSDRFNCQNERILALTCMSANLVRTCPSAVSKERICRRSNASDSALESWSISKSCFYG